MRFEIVQTDAGWHARIKGGNGEIVWTTEVYTRHEDADNAVTELMGEMHTFTDVRQVDHIDERTGA